MKTLTLIVRIYVAAALASAAVLAVLMIAWTFAVGLTVIAGVSA